MQTVNPTPEQIDALAFELHTMGVQVPPRDTAFFHAAVRKWLATMNNTVAEFVACGHAGDGPTYQCLLCGQAGTDHPAVLRRALREADTVLEEWIGILRANGLRSSAIDGEALRGKIAPLIDKS